MHAITHSRVTLVLATAVTAVLLAACGGSNKPPSAAGPGPSKQGPGIDAAYKYSRCMRQHGVPGFPDPKVHSSGGHTELSLMVTPAQTGAPAFKTAQKDCAAIIPMGNSANDGRTPAQQQAYVQGLISFANCMRGRGINSFPDPNSQGRITPEMIAAANIDLKAPAIRTSAIDCVPASHGQLSKAQVEQALGPPQ